MYKQIAENKRKTVFIIIGFVIMIGAIAGVFAYFYKDSWIAVWTVVVSIIYALIQYYLAGDIAMAMTGAKEIAKKDNPRLYNIVENLSITTGLPMPKVYVIDDKAPNAFATGRDPKHAAVAATTGLVDIMDDKELTAVMAHEMSHVKNYDIRVSMIVFGLVCVIGLISDIAFRMMFYGNRRRDNEGSPVGYALIVIAAILSPIVAGVAQMAVSRQREYLADASAVNITRYPEGMIAALKKLQSHSQPMKSQNIATEAMYINNPLRKGFFSNLFSSHPPIEKRIERLEHGKKTF
ncbi:MAG: zinc metalloprotease HtpX [Candidatus Saccharibacteria bacterium]|uniref:Protease HtpX homolog n=1 Tax=Candidatus Nanosyncoccus alces TaxID=2171997 RepID=A0ABY0FPU7_9BACT|nr:zinc metalloprotease HtpX [Candidatus Nanosyncoccus alces]MDO4398828.1 zinc metalloprotease HtpX [Candidatus Saccharibacteria bacterium]RYC75102.1 Protease HtpX [Candidatus Nanosyncoccus alces]